MIILKSKVSHIIFHKIAKYNKPFSERDFIKDCMIESAAVINPEKIKPHKNLSLSRRTVVRRIECIAKNIQSHLKNKIHNFTYISLALDGSRDIRDTEQLLIFIRGINNTFKLTEKLESVQSMKDSVTGKDFLIEVEECVSDLVLDWVKLINVTTAGCPSFIGKNKGLL